MPPSATLPQNAPETAVGRSVKARNVVGSTPSVATYFPLTLIRAASIRPAATTPGTRRTAASVPAGSDVPETTRTSAASSLPGGEVMAASGDEDARGSGSILVAERDSSESSTAGAVLRWAALPAVEGPAMEGQAAATARTATARTATARTASAAHDTGARRRNQVRAGAGAGTREVTQTSLPTLLPMLAHLYRIFQG